MGAHLGFPQSPRAGPYSGGDLRLATDPAVETRERRGVLDLGMRQNLAHVLQFVGERRQRRVFLG